MEKEKSASAASLLTRWLVVRKVHRRAELRQRGLTIDVDGWPIGGILGTVGDDWGKMGGQIMLLTGSYRRALDDKLRLAVPKPLREQLPAETPLYLTPGLDGCLAIYPQPAFAALADRLGSGSPAAREVRDYSRLFFSQASMATPDSQWRLRIPPELISWANLSGESVIVGVRDHIEVWSALRWEHYVAQCDGHYEQLAEAALMPPTASRTQPAPDYRSEDQSHEESRPMPR